MRTSVRSVMMPLWRTGTQRTTVLHQRQILLHQHRLSSTAPEGKPVSPHIAFYKTFGRPIAKVLLMSVFVYQLAYWAWVKLEKDEIKGKQTAEIAELEQKLKDVLASKEK